MFKKSSRVLLVTLLLFVLAGSSYAFAAGNTGLDSFAGDGTGDISGYAVSNLQYTTSAGNVTAVSFSLDNPARVVQASINGGTLNACSLATTTWTCNFSSPVTILAATSLRVVAVQ